MVWDDITLEFGGRAYLCITGTAFINFDPNSILNITFDQKRMLKTLCMRTYEGLFPRVDIISSSIYSLLDLIMGP